MEPLQDVVGVEVQLEDFVEVALVQDQEDVAVVEDQELEGD